jgi:mono/diheme cytochrome c family protein
VEVILMKKPMILLFVGAVALSTLALDSHADHKDAAAVQAGRKLFMKHCATCHGTDAKGKGPVSAALKTGPPDLTIIKTPGEKFPTYRIATIIDGEKDVTAHGTRKMPVWGTIFRRSEGDLLRQANIYSLVKYIESIQTAKD